MLGISGVAEELQDSEEALCTKDSIVASTKNVPSRLVILCAFNESRPQTPATSYNELQRNAFRSIYVFPFYFVQQLKIFERRKSILLFKIFIFLPILPTPWTLLPDVVAPPPPQNMTLVILY